MGRGQKSERHNRSHGPLYPEGGHGHGHASQLYRGCKVAEGSLWVLRHSSLRHPPAEEGKDLPEAPLPLDPGTGLQTLQGYTAQAVLRTPVVTENPPIPSDRSGQTLRLALSVGRAGEAKRGVWVREEAPAFEGGHPRVSAPSNTAPWVPHLSVSLGPGIAK